MASTPYPARHAYLSPSQRAPSLRGRITLYPRMSCTCRHHSCSGAAHFFSLLTALIALAALLTGLAVLELTVGDDFPPLLLSTGVC